MTTTTTKTRGETDDGVYRKERKINKFEPRKDEAKIVIRKRKKEKKKK